MAVTISPKRSSRVADLFGVKAKKSDSKPALRTLLDLVDRSVELKQPRWVEARDYFRASQAGEQCLRALLLKCAGHSPPVEARVMRIFATGNAIEAAIISTFELAELELTTQVPLTHDDPPIKGSADAVVDTKLCEIKSINSRRFAELPKEHELMLAGESPLMLTHSGYIIQWNTYSALSGVHEGFILFENKDTQHQKVFWLKFDATLWNETIKRHERANEFLKQQQIPQLLDDYAPHKKDPRCKWCAHRSLCLQLPKNEVVSFEQARKIDEETLSVK